MLLPIDDRKNKSRHILHISGIKQTSYWLGIFLTDYILFLIPVALFAIMVAVSNLTVYS